MSELPDDLLPAPEIFYDPHTSGKCFFVRNDRKNFIPVTEANLKRMLKDKGYSHEVTKGQLVSQLDKFLNKVQVESDVDYAGPLAGYLTGYYDIQNRRVLVTEGPRFIKEDQGPWPTLKKLIYNLLVPPSDDPEKVDEIQTHYLFSWLKVGITALRAGKRRPGQVLVLAGPPGCGKSLLQNFITKLLGGRSGKPYQFMTGGTQFNSELFHAEHLMIEDEAASFDYRVRVKMGASLKGFVVNEDQRCHPKNRPALTLRPFWRLSITLNDDPESLMVMPPVEGIQDKVTMLRAFKAEMPMPTETLEQWGAFMHVLDSELPAFVHFLLKEWQIPSAHRCNRYGVGHFHHPELLEMMSVLSPETKLLELIDARTFPKDAPIWNEWEGKASELETELCSPGSSVAHEARKLLLYNSACGQYLGRIERAYPERVSSRLLKGQRIWIIQPPAKV